MPNTTPFAAYRTLNVVAFARRDGDMWELTFNGPPTVQLPDRLFAQLFQPVTVDDLRPGMATPWVLPYLDAHAEGTVMADLKSMVPGRVEETNETRPDATAEPATPRRARDFCFDWHRAKALYEQGAPVSQVAKELGCTGAAVYQHRKAGGWTRKTAAAPLRAPHRAAVYQHRKAGGWTRKTAAAPLRAPHECPRCCLKTEVVPCQHCHQSHPELEAAVA